VEYIVTLRTVLVIDTATPDVIAGVARVTGAGVELLAEKVTSDPRAHAETLTPNILAALADCGLRMSDLDAVVVGCGPGPFTGLRVGMASAAAYGHALGIPVHGVCSLDGIGAGGAGEVLVVTDARRREVYWARYRDGVRVEEPQVGPAADLEVGAAVGVAGSPEHAKVFGLPVLPPDRPSVAGLIAAVGDWESEPQPLVPLYLRRPDAKTLAERGVR